MKRILVTGAGGSAASNFICSLRLAEEPFFIAAHATSRRRGLVHRVVDRVDQPEATLLQTFQHSRLIAQLDLGPLLVQGLGDASAEVVDSQSGE